MFPSIPRILRTLLVLATSATLLAFPFPTLGAKGADLAADVHALISAVSPGGQMAFSASFHNTGTATISHLRFDGTAPGSSFVSGTAPCEGSGESVGCDIGQLPSGAQVSLTLIYTAPGAAADVEFSGAFSGDAGQGNPNAAKRDMWEDDPSENDTTVTVDASGDYFGTWQHAHGAERTFVTAAIGGDNHQSTTVVVPAVGFDYAAIVSETDAEIVCDGASLDGIGQTVELTIADGDPVMPFIEVTLVYDSVASEGSSPGQVSVVHVTDAGDCEFPPANCRQNAGFCYETEWSGHGTDKLLVVHVQLPSNGRMKGV